MRTSYNLMQSKFVLPKCALHDLNVVLKVNLVKRGLARVLEQLDSILSAAHTLINKQGYTS